MKRLLDWMAVHRAGLVGATVFCLCAAGVAWAQQTNYLGTVFIADYSTPSRQLHVNADGSLNVNATGGGPSSLTANQGTANAGGTAAWPVQGAAAGGAAVTGNPVLVGGSDGTNARTFVTDSSGRPLIVGPETSGSAVVGGGLRVMGSDGTNARDLKTDSGGYVAAFNGSGPQSLGVDSTTDGLFTLEAGRSFSNITSATTTTIKSGSGWLHTININTYVASATITVYDNTAGSGTKIATITLPSTITSDVPVTMTFDIRFATGLTIVTSGATDITTSYR